MKRLNHKHILYGIAALSLVSCAVPKVADLKKAQTLPETPVKTASSEEVSAAESESLFYRCTSARSF
jgi:hypothetical protein